MIKILKYVGFIGSGIISYMLMITLCNTVLDYTLAFGMTLVLKYSSFYCFNKAIKEKDFLKKSLSSTLAAMLFLISIVGTISFQFGIQNNAKNEQLVNSDSYRIAQENREIKKNNVINKQNQISSLKSNLEARIQSLDESISEYRKLEKAQNQLYTFRINKVNEEKIKLRKEFEEKSDKLNSELSSLSSLASQEFKVGNVELSATKGYLPLMEAFSKWFNVDMQILTLIFQSFIACVFECTAIYLHLEDVSGKKSQSRNQAKVQDNQAINKQPSNVIKLEKKQGKITQVEIEKFKQAKQKLQSEGKANGIKAIANYLKITENRSRLINLEINKKERKMA